MRFPAEERMVGNAQRQQGDDLNLAFFVGESFVDPKIVH